MCKGAKYQIQMIEKLSVNRRTNRGSMDLSWTSIRITKQTEWINRLCAAFPYGQNNKI